MRGTFNVREVKKCYPGGSLVHLCSREIQIRAPFDLCGLPFVLEVGISKFRSSTTPELDIKMAAKGVNDKQSTRPSVLLVLVQKWLPTGLVRESLRHLVFRLFWLRCHFQVRLLSDVDGSI